MDQVNRSCQNCRGGFRIEPEDLIFYEKIKVPPPTFCPECRLIRRLAWRQDRTLYKDTCNLCNKEIFSIFHPDAPYTVYCPQCWWSDKWDPLSHGKVYDFNKPFFEQYNDLLHAVPRLAFSITKSTNCNYCDSTINSKNCYLSFGGYFVEDCLYCNAPIMSRTCVDSDLGMNMDHAYETYNSDAVYNTKFVWFSDECFDASFLFDCRGCSNCFGCTNLRTKKYHIFNKPHSRDEYRKQMQYWDMGSYKKIQEARQKFEALYYTTPRRFAWMTNAINVVGDNIKNTKNCYTCFATVNGVENCKYIFIGGLNLKDSYDAGYGGDVSELLYEGMGVLRSQRLFFFKGGTEMTDSEYCENCRDSQYLFGCTGVRSKKYCILNKQYSKEEYEALVPKIKKHMLEMPYTDKQGIKYRYGEYFPTELSPWSYNESFAYQWFPLTKEEALQKGFQWHDREKRDYAVTIEAKNLPDHIKDTSDTILNEVIGCLHEGKCHEECTTAFRIIPEELKFYRDMNIALPRFCHNCRYYQRIRFRNPAKLWHRTCQCAGKKSEKSIYVNTATHVHGERHCPNEFETAYSPERREIVYCEGCYKNEFI